MANISNLEKRKLRWIGIFLFLLVTSVLTIMHIDQYWLGNQIGYFSLISVTILWSLVFYYIREILLSKKVVLSAFHKYVLLLIIIGIIDILFAVGLTLWIGELWGATVLGAYIVVLIGSVIHHYEKKITTT